MTCSECTRPHAGHELVPGIVLCSERCWRTYFSAMLHDELSARLEELDDDVNDARYDVHEMKEKIKELEGQVRKLEGKLEKRRH